MTRIDRYWKRAAAGLMAAAMLMVWGNGTQLESFAMTGTQPFQKSGEQVLSSPGQIIISDGQAGNGAQNASETNIQAIGQGAQPVLQGVQITSDGSQSASQAGASSASVPAGDVQIAAFGDVSTPVVDSSSYFGPGRLTMYANHETAAQNLSVIIENGAGGLIVVDGGWTDNAEFLLNQIKQKGGHVVAWLITHPDSDHVGALADILYKHSGEITIDGIYYSFLEDSWYGEKDSSVAGMVGYVKGAFANVPQESLHGNIVAGQVIDAGPAKIQVLNQAYKTTSDFVNNSSVAYLVSLNGTNVVFLGDLARAGGAQLMADRDLGALKCTMVQMAHHGQSGVDYEVYKALRPSVCLWPTPQWLWDNDNGGGAGSGIWRTMETRNWMVRLGVKTNYCIKDGDQVIE